MIRSVLMTILTLVAAESRAGTLTCHFTEPFFTIVFDSATGRVVRSGSDDGSGIGRRSVLATDARLERRANEREDNTFALTSGGREILMLRLDGRGSDGMSERIYPFRGRYRRQEGGCDTVHDPAWDFDALLDDLRAR
jgi:uncharacterized membrane protein